MAKKDSLTDYQKKRDFARTPEPAAKKKPAGKKKTSQKGHLFVIHKHDATHLHYDLRLEIDGILKSWAVPKGPSMDPSQKRLAVLVEDHPLDYGKFEGTIAEDQYGGGTVMLWDTGRYSSLKMDASGNEIPMRKSFNNGRIEIVLVGKKLQGGFVLIRTRMTGKQIQWLLIKMKDEYAQPGKDILVDQPDSAVSGRSLEEISNE